MAVTHVNGKPNNQAALLDRGLLYGDGFFTTIRIIEGKIHRWPLHLERISFSADRLKFVGLDADLIHKELVEFITDQDSSNGVVRLSITRGANNQGSRGYSIPANPNYNRIYSWSDFDYGAIKALNKGVSLSLCESPAAKNKLLAGIKHLNRLEQVLASSEINEGCFDGLMHNGKFLISGTKSNVYFYINNRWLTPKVNKSGVDGTVRRWLLESQDNVFQSQFGLEILERAEYCLVSNAIVGIIPVTGIQTANGVKQFKVFPELEKLQLDYEEAPVTY